METDKPPRTHRSGQIKPHFFGRHRGTLAHIADPSLGARVVYVRYGASVAEETSDPAQAYTEVEWFWRERPPYWARLPWA